MKRKSLLGLLVACALAVVGVFSPAFADGTQSWIPIIQGQDAPGFHLISFKDISTLKHNYSILTTTKQNDTYLCKSTSDPVCSGDVFDYNSILKVCQNSADVDCVTSLQAIDANHQTTSATFQHYTVENHINAFPGDKKLGIPEGSMPSIWEIPSAPHQSGDLYAVIAGETGEVYSSGWDTGQLPTLAVALIPVVLTNFGNQQNNTGGPGWGATVPSNVYYDFCSVIQQTPTNKNIGCGHVLGDACILPTAVSEECYTEEAFPSDFRFNMKLRLAKEPNGWMHGRMTDPDIQISKDSNGSVDLSVTAGSTQVPLMYQAGMWANLPTSLQQYWVKLMSAQDWGAQGEISTSSSAPDYGQQSATLAGNATTNLFASLNSFGQAALEGIAAISPVVDNKANIDHSSWSFRTLSNAEMNGADKCFSSTPGIKGIVTTNSTAYSAGPPAFTGGALNYKVASPHFNPDGTTPFKGNYNLVIRSDVARCIYGFSSAPISASISIISSDGSDDVATTVAGEKDGWLSLSANGFEFSSPVIQVKLTQNGSSAPAAGQKASAPSVVKPPLKVTTITCVKGSTTKKVSGISPVCPSGYKKK